MFPLRSLSPILPPKSSTEPCRDCSDESGIEMAIPKTGPCNSGPAQEYYTRWLELICEQARCPRRPGLTFRSLLPHRSPIVRAGARRPALSCTTAVPRPQSRTNSLVPPEGWTDPTARGGVESRCNRGFKAMHRSSVSWLGLIVLALPLATGPARPSLSQVALDGSVNSDVSRAGTARRQGLQHPRRVRACSKAEISSTASSASICDTGQRAIFSGPGSTAHRQGHQPGHRRRSLGHRRHDSLGHRGRRLLLHQPRRRGLRPERATRRAEARSTSRPRTSCGSRTAKSSAPRNPADSSFSVAAPDAFGFLDRDAGAQSGLDRSELRRRARQDPSRWSAATSSSIVA